MRRSYSPYASSYSFGPGPVSTALKALLIANVAIFFLQAVVPGLEQYLALSAAQVADLQVWRLVTYMFLHVGIAHILFNMLALWMFGTELERLWGTRFFLKYYFVTGVGAAVLTVIGSMTLPFLGSLYEAPIVGASGAVYGLLLGYGLAFPSRTVYMYFVFPIPAKYFVIIMGAIAFFSSIQPANGVAHITHLGGLLVGYLYLRGLRRMRTSPWAEVKYRYLKWKINRVRKKFDVYQGGRADDWDRRVH